MAYCLSRQAAFFAVTDGLGGHPHGDVAAETALRSMVHQFQDQRTAPDFEAARFLTSAILHAHTAVSAIGPRSGLSEGPRTTVVAAVIKNGMLQYANCGDSRLYMVRQGYLMSRTRDHSAAEMRPDGFPISAPAADERNLLYTCLGAPQVPRIRLSKPRALEAGDRVLLCSDGMWGALDEGMLVAILGAVSLDSVLTRLVNGALDAAGAQADNTTGLMFEWGRQGAVAARGVVRHVNTERMRTDDFFTSLD